MSASDEMNAWNDSRAYGSEWDSSTPHPRSPWADKQASSVKSNAVNYFIFLSHLTGRRF